MAEYVDREAVRERLERVFMLQAQTAKKLVDDIPTADVKPVVRGEWIGFQECMKYPNAHYYLELNAEITIVRQNESKEEEE